AARAGGRRAGGDGRRRQPADHAAGLRRLRLRVERPGRRVRSEPSVCHVRGRPGRINWCRPRLLPLTPSPPSESFIMVSRDSLLLASLAFALLPAPPAPAADADLILHSGKVVTLDGKSSVHQALAVRGDHILRVGTNDEVLKA